MKLNLFFLSAAALVSAATATDKVDLGEADFYVILARSGIHSAAGNDKVAITGNIGVWPIAHTAITNFEIMVRDLGGQFAKTDEVTRKVHAKDFGGQTETDLITAVSDMEAAYTDAAGRPNTDGARINVDGGNFNVATKDFTPGVYTFGTGVAINADITFDAENDGDAVFIIQISGNIIQAAYTKVILKNGAKAKNIFWQVAGFVEVGADSTMEGILLVKTKVDFLADSILNGRVFTQTACTLLKGATITEKPVFNIRRSLRGDTN
jgi:hypothetical protein